MAERGERVEPVQDKLSQEFVARVKRVFPHDEEGSRSFWEKWKGYHEGRSTRKKIRDLLSLEVPPEYSLTPARLRFIHPNMSREPAGGALIKAWCSGEGYLALLARCMSQGAVYSLTEKDRKIIENSSRQVIADMLRWGASSRRVLIEAVEQGFWELFPALKFRELGRRKTLMATELTAYFRLNLPQQGDLYQTDTFPSTIVAFEEWWKQLQSLGFIFTEREVQAVRRHRSTLSVAWKGRPDQDGNVIREKLEEFLSSAIIQKQKIPKARKSIPREPEPPMPLPEIAQAPPAPQPELSPTSGEVPNGVNLVYGHLTARIGKEEDSLRENTKRQAPENINIMGRDGWVLLGGKYARRVNEDRAVVSVDDSRGRVLVAAVDGMGKERNAVFAAEEVAKAIQRAGVSLDPEVWRREMQISADFIASRSGEGASGACFAAALYDRRLGRFRLFYAGDSRAAILVHDENSGRWREVAVTKDENLSHAPSKVTNFIGSDASQSRAQVNYRDLEVRSGQRSVMLVGSDGFWEAFLPEPSSGVSELVNGILWEPKKDGWAMGSLDKVPEEISSQKGSFLTVLKEDQFAAMLKIYQDALDVYYEYKLGERKGLLAVDEDRRNAAAVQKEISTRLVVWAINQKDTLPEAIKLLSDLREIFLYSGVGGKHDDVSMVIYECPPIEAGSEADGLITTIDEIMAPISKLVTEARKREEGNRKEVLEIVKKYQLIEDFCKRCRDLLKNPERVQSGVFYEDTLEKHGRLACEAVTAIRGTSTKGGIPQQLNQALTAFEGLYPRLWEILH